MTGREGMLTPAEYRDRQARAMLEAVLQLRVTELASLFGWLWYHPPDNRPDARGRRQATRPGFPDLVLVRGDRVLYRELKRQTGKPTEDQLIWHERLRAAGCDVAVWRPLDYLDGTVEADLRRAG